jgi:hypothetical protein
MLSGNRDAMQFWSAAGWRWREDLSPDSRPHSSHLTLHASDRPASRGVHRTAGLRLADAMVLRRQWVASGYCAYTCVRRMHIAQQSLSFEHRDATVS